MDKAERLLDLVALLLDAREPVSFAELRDLFPDEYGGSRAAAERKLERDKADLLDLGVPIEYVAPEQLDERDLGGYRIDRKTFFLPDPRLLPEESAALYAAGAAALATREFPARGIRSGRRSCARWATRSPAASASTSITKRRRDSTASPATAPSGTSSRGASLFAAAPGGWWAATRRRDSGCSWWSGSRGSRSIR